MKQASFGEKEIHSKEQNPAPPACEGGSAWPVEFPDLLLSLRGSAHRDGWVGGSAFYL
jgi:hypothetical protein